MEIESSVNLADLLNAIFTLVIAAVGGVWVIYQYRMGRRGEANVEIRPTLRLRETHDEAILLVHLRISNTSGVQYIHESATATLMDASSRALDGNVRLLPFARKDPLLPVYQTMSKDNSRILAGELFEPFATADAVVLDPKEYVETELAFALRHPLNLMALRVTLNGRKRGLVGRDASYEWSTFLFIDPDSLRAVLGEECGQATSKAKVAPRQV
jgi:hypothetical protein